MKVSVVIPALNEEDFIGDTLESLMNQLEPADEIIVVDNGSTDRTQAVIRKFSEVKLVEENQQGAGFALKTGIESTNHKLICGTDADTVVPRYWIREYKKCFQQDPKIGVATGPCLYVNAPRWVEVGSRLLPQLRQIGYEGDLIGANFAIRKSIYDSIGGVDVSLKSGWDIDLGQKAKRISEVAYLSHIWVETSGRRFNVEPLTTIPQYFRNYLGVIFGRKELIQPLKDIRKK